MPPKRNAAVAAATASGGSSKAGKKSSGGGAAAASAAGSAVDELRAMADLHATLERAQEVRSHMQAERDAADAAWSVAKQELEHARLRVHNTASELEEDERAHQLEMKVYKQKLRHLLYDQRVRIKQLREESDAALQQAEVAHERRMSDIHAERQRRLKEVQQAAEQSELQMTEQRDSHAYMVRVTKKQNHERELARLRAAYEAKLSSLRESLELRRRAEVNDVEQRRNEHINRLVEQHATKFAEVKAYYNHITTNNLDMIASLKEEIAVMRQNDEHNEALMYEIEKENGSLAAPLAQAQQDVAELQVKKQQHLQNTQSLRMTSARLRMLQDELRTLREQHATLQAQYARVSSEREELRGRFEDALREAMDVVSERNADLQQSLLEANALVEARDAQFAGVLQAMQLPPSTMASVCDAIDAELRAKNQTIKDLHYELRKAEQKVQAVLQEYERRCRAAKLPPLSHDSFTVARDAAE